MEFPNKIFVSEYKGDNPQGGISHFVIIIAASDKTIAQQHIKQQIGIDKSPEWMMNAVYPTIYTSDGSKPHPIQAKILYNGSFHTNFRSK